MTQTLAETSKRIMEGQEIRVEKMLHSAEEIFELPPENHRCDCCGKHVSEIIPYGGMGDPLLHDYSGLLLLKRYRPMFDTRKEYAALKEAEMSFQKDGMKDPEEWLVAKYGREEAERILDFGVGDDFDKSWECRDCMFISNGEFFDKFDRCVDSDGRPMWREEVKKSSAFQKERVLPMHETNFLKVVLEEDKIVSLLNDTGFGGVNELKKIGESNYSYNRKSVKYECKYQNLEITRNVVIDVTSSELSAEQIENVIYDLGADCDERIVVFASFIGKHNDDRRSVESIQDLILEMNQYGVNIALVKVNVNESHFWSEVLISPSECAKDKSGELPTKEEFCKIAFWETFFADADGQDVRYFYGPLNGNSQEGSIFLGSMYLVFDWTNEGARLSLKGEEKVRNYVKRFWEAKESDIRSASKGFDVEFRESEDDGPMINIILFRIPVSILTILSVEEKKAYAGLFQSTFRRFYRLMVTWAKDQFS